MTQQSPDQVNPVRSARPGVRASRGRAETDAGTRSAASMILFLVTMTLAVWYYCARYFEDPLLGLIFAGIVLVTIGGPAIGASVITGTGSSRRQP